MLKGLVDLVNNLYEENKKLKEENKELERLENVLQSFSKRDLLDIERIFLQNIRKELKED